MTLIFRMPRGYNMSMNMFQYPCPLQMVQSNSLPLLFVHYLAVHSKKNQIVYVYVYIHSGIYIYCLCMYACMLVYVCISIFSFKFFYSALHRIFNFAQCIFLPQTPKQHVWVANFCEYYSFCKNKIGTSPRVSEDTIHQKIYNSHQKISCRH
jgi:hypothetical protein